MAANTKIQFRRGYSANYSGPQIGLTPLESKWSDSNEIRLAEGEIGYEIDTGKFKIGRLIGGTLPPWSQLPYAGGSALLAQSGVGYTRDENTNSYTIYSYLGKDDNNITIDTDLLSSLIPDASGTYYKLGLADNLTNIKNVTLTENLSAASGTFTGSVSISQGLTTQGNIVSNNLDLTSIINRLIPAQPPIFPGVTTLQINGTTSHLMCSNFTQPSNSNSNITVANGTAVPVRLSNSYTTNSISNVGIGSTNTGVVILIRNSGIVGTWTIDDTPPSNGTNGELTISDNKDYSTISSAAAGFWQVFSASGTGSSVPSGWNAVIMSGANNLTNRATWYYDANTTAAPTLTNLSVVTGVGTLFRSSSVPHYSGTFVVSFDAQRLSGDTYSNTFADNIPATNGLASLGTPTRVSVGLPNILPQNAYVSSAYRISITGNSATTFANITPANFRPTISIYNSNNKTTIFPAPSQNVLLKTLSGPNASFLQEDNIPVGNQVQLGSDFTSYGVRISGYPNSSDTPQSGIVSTWNSDWSLHSGDAAVVGGVLSHNITDYTNFTPAGPNLSTNRSGAQYFTFRITRAGVSQLNLRLTTTGIAGIWFRLPGTSMDTTLGNTFGWADATKSAGTTFTNETNGCAVGTPVPINSPITNGSYNITFQTNNSVESNPANEIHVRIKLVSGQSISALSIQGTS